MTHPTFSEIRECVAACYDPDSYYITKYRHEELGYCGAIPAEMENYMRPGHTVLDIGPGYGTLAAWASELTNNRVTTVDRVPYMTIAVRSRFGIRALTEFDIERFTVASPSLLEALDSLPLDHVIMTECLEHFNLNPIPTLTRIRQAMSGSGRLYLSTPAGGSAVKTGPMSAKGWCRMIHPQWPQGVPLDGNRLEPITVFDLPSFNPRTMTYDHPKWYDGHVWHYNQDELHKLLITCGFETLVLGTSESSGGKHFNIVAGCA
jgi:SAM-dependent methyltransferase